MPGITRVRWYPPLASLTGPETTIELDGPATVGDLLQRLCREQPKLLGFARLDKDTGAVIGLIVLCGNDLMKDSDRVEPGGTLDIMAAIEGG